MFVTLMMFKIDLIVWKFSQDFFLVMPKKSFKIDLIVWKLNSAVEIIKEDSSLK